jgi:hypothetical protein
MNPRMVTHATLTAVASCALLLACGKKEVAPPNTLAAAPTGVVLSNANPVPNNPTASTAPTGKFEGEIVVDVKNEEGQKLPASVTFDIKGDKVAYAPKTAGVRAVDDLAAQHAYVISDAKKAYTDLDTKASTDAATAPVRVERSAKEEKVAGLGCEDWTIDDGIEKVDVCAAKDIAFFDLAGNPKPGNAEPAWARALTMKKAFPLRIVVHDRDGKEEYRAEAFEVNWKKMDDLAFRVPAGFRKGDLASDAKMASLP